MFLILGTTEDQCVCRVRDALERSGLSSLILANPMIDPVRFQWDLDNDVCTSQLEFSPQLQIKLNDLCGVLVRSHGWIDPHGWESSDIAYVQAEMQAALLAWMWSLACPVINRYSPSMWYCPNVPLLFWRNTLRNCGLEILETLVTNAEEETHALRERLGLKGIVGAVYGPLTSQERYLVIDDQDWNGLVKLQRVAPVSLSEPHGQAQILCVVGERVIWQGAPSQDLTELEPNLRQFVAAAGLEMVELALAPANDSVRVIAVELQPRFELFDNSAQDQIVNAIVHLLTKDRTRIAGRC